MTTAMPDKCPRCGSLERENARLRSVLANAHEALLYSQKRPNAGLTHALQDAAIADINELPGVVDDDDSDDA